MVHGKIWITRNFGSKAEKVKKGSEGNILKETGF